MTANIKAIEALYNSNEAFRNTVDKALAAEHQRLIKAASIFEVSRADTVTEEVKPNRIPGSKNHKAAVLAAINAKGGSASIGEIRMILANDKHEITNSTLTTVLHNMKVSNELNVTGAHGHGLYSIPATV